MTEAYRSQFTDAYGGNMSAEKELDEFMCIETTNPNAMFGPFPAFQIYRLNKQKTEPDSSQAIYDNYTPSIIYRSREACEAAIKVLMESR